MSVEREVRWLVDGVLGDEPKRALACHRILQTDYLPWLERRSVWRLRRAGIGWAGIGRLLGRTRQAVFQRFGSAPTMADIAPPSLGFPTDGWRTGVTDPDRREIAIELSRIRDLEQAAECDAVVPW